MHFCDGCFGCFRDKKYKKLEYLENFFDKKFSVFEN